ncbi:hypothetical protein ACNTMW_32200 [Planosporangium sp. 12N6]|uniref:hypothetical protein n=1 Tax=Planosporangium spinosum TaxID=3402278 RepID=UPI003CF81E50
MRNDRYEVAVDTAKNRLYLVVKGYWSKPQEVPDYVDDLVSAAQRLRPAFTMVSDCTQMRPHHEDVMPVHLTAQQEVMKVGLARVAEVLPGAGTRLQARRMSNNTGMFKAEFDDRAEAEAWLDSELAN